MWTLADKENGEKTNSGKLNPSSTLLCRLSSQNLEFRPQPRLQSRLQLPKTIMDACVVGEEVSGWQRSIETGLVRSGEKKNLVPGLIV